MMKKLKLLLLFLLAASFAYAQDAIEEDWVRADSVFISGYIKAFKTNPLHVERYLKPDRKRKENLGFGYTSIEGSIGRGYVSVFYQFIYFNDKPISYRLAPQMPRDGRLTARYKKFYQPLYRFDDKDVAQVLYYNFKKVMTPLPGNADSPSGRALAYFMSPFSGVVYGYLGGESSSKLENRAAYDFVKAKLKPEDYLMLLYSINPATRLTAIEHYYRNVKLFEKYKQEIEIRIKEIYRELPEIQTMNGCILTTDSSKELVDFYVKELGRYKN